MVVDDGSSDYTDKLMEEFDPRIDVVYLRLRKPEGLWRDCASVLNYGLRACSGSVIFATHPEVCIGRRSLQFAADTASADDTYAACRIYYLSPIDQERIDSVDWEGEGPLAVRNIEGFYDPREGHPDYHPSETDKVAKPGGRIPVWESWVAASLSRKTWSHLGGFIPTTAWGSVDLLFLQRRRRLGIRNITSPDDDTICLHQNHDLPSDKFVPTDRDMGKCFAQAGQLTVEQCKFPFVDELWGAY